MFYIQNTYSRLNIIFRPNGCEKWQNLAYFYNSTEYTTFHDRMTVHRNRFLVNKVNRYTEFQFHWYYYSTCFGQSFWPSSEVLSRKFDLVHFMQLWWPIATRSRKERSSILLLVATGHRNCIKMYQSRCTTKNSWWWTERLPETCRVVIPMKLEFSVSVGFIHRESEYRDVLTPQNRCVIRPTKLKYQHLI
jgi:hypothetical protein